MSSPQPAAPAAQPAEPGLRVGRGRTAVAAVLIVLGSLLVPAAILAGWAREMLGDTDTLVAALGPVIEDPAVQGYLSQQVAASINDALDIDGLVDAGMDGLLEVVQGDRARAALEALRVPAADGLRAAIENGTAQAVSSQRFVQAWNEALQRSHEIVVAVLGSDSSSVVAVVEGGLGVQLGPLVEQVRAELQTRGFELASQIPDTDRVIVLVPAENLPQLQAAYQFAMAVGYWLGLVAFGLVAAGVAVSRNPPRSALVAALAWAAGALVVLAGVWAAGVVARAAVPDNVMPDDVLTTFYEAVTLPLVDGTLAVLLLAVAAAMAAWLLGPFRSSRRARAGWDRLRTGLRARGLDTGGAGRWLRDRSRALRILIGAVAVVILLVNRSLTVAAVFWTLLGAAVLLGLLGLLEQPAETETGAEEAEEPSTSSGS